MSILIDENTTFIVQGITGREAVNLTGFEVVGSRSERDVRLCGDGTMIDGRDAAASDHPDRGLQQQPAPRRRAVVSAHRRG